MPLGRWALLAITAIASACADEVAPQRSGGVLVEFEQVVQGPYGATARYRMTHAGEVPVAYQGNVDGSPDFRCALLSDGRWIEREPAWVTCATGRALHTLAPGDQVSFEVPALRVDLPMRLGIGWWAPREGDPPRWPDWNWVWSAGARLEEHGAIAIR